MICLFNTLGKRRTMALSMAWMKAGGRVVSTGEGTDKEKAGEGCGAEDFLKRESSSVMVDSDLDISFNSFSRKEIFFLSSQFSDLSNKVSLLPDTTSVTQFERDRPTCSFDIDLLLYIGLDTAFGTR